MMAPGAITDDIDLVQVALVVFALFFAGLVVYLRREDKREGYGTLQAGRRQGVVGWPLPPPPKTYRLMDGTTAVMPHVYPQEPLADDPRVAAGRAFVPSDPLRAGLGAGASALRSDAPMRTMDKAPLLMPLRNASGWAVQRGEMEPRGMPVLARNFVPVGRVVDIWIDRAAKILRYFEVALDDGRGVILVPIFHCQVYRRRAEIRVLVLRASQFDDVPKLAAPDIMTAREEDQLNAFFAGATIYADA